MRGCNMAQKKNLSDQLNEYGTDEECLRGIDFVIQKNVMIWGGTILQLSNISSISSVLTCSFLALLLPH